MGRCVARSNRGHQEAPGLYEIMRVLFITGQLITGDLPWRLSEEGCDVKLFIEHPAQQECQSGFVTKVDDWRPELDWVGKSGLIVFDDVGHGKLQDQLRQRGFRVFGGSEGGERLELDREFAQQLLASLGMETLPTLRFDHPVAGARHIMNVEPDRWVIKQNDHDYAVNYVGESADGSDVAEVLESYQKVGIRDVSIQRAVNGIEFAVGRFFNGRNWIGPIELNVEHKALCDGDIGPKTGEMGNLAWYSDDENQPLFRKVLSPLRDYLLQHDFRGNIDVNCLIDNQRVVPIEVTARLGCPSTHIQGALNITPWRDFLGAVADGRDMELQYRRSYGVGITIAVPPFPYFGDVASRYSSAGYPVRFRSEPSPADRLRHYHFESVGREAQPDGVERLFVTHGLGYAAFVTGTGNTMQAAVDAAYSGVNNLCIPKAIYRTDIGKKFIDSNSGRLHAWGWI